MIHPVKAATSFECDGCGHHASFHKMENTAEEKVTARWRLADGSFDHEAYMQDEEVQEILAARRAHGITRGMSSNLDVLMPEKARNTLIGTSRKRSRTTKLDF
jgi:hypothetical protein